MEQILEVLAAATLTTFFYELLINFHLFYRIQSVSNLKKKIQNLNTNIILNLNESYKEAAVQEAKYKGEGTADYYKQQQIVIPAPQYINTSTAGRKLQGSLGVPQAGQPRYASNLFNKKTGALAPLDPEYQS